MDSSIIIDPVWTELDAGRAVLDLCSSCAFNCYTRTPQETVAMIAGA